MCGLAWLEGGLWGEEAWSAKAAVWQLILSCTAHRYVSLSCFPPAALRAPCAPPILLALLLLCLRGAAVKVLLVPMGRAALWQLVKRQGTDTVLRWRFLGAGWLPVSTTWDARCPWLFFQACAPSNTSLGFLVWGVFVCLFLSFFIFLPSFTSRLSPGLFPDLCSGLSALKKTSHLLVTEGM